VASAEPLHKFECGRRPCRPGEGNLRGYDQWTQPYAPIDEAALKNLSKGPPHRARGPHYDALTTRAVERAGPGIRIYL